MNTYNFLEYLGLKTMTKASNYVQDRLEVLTRAALVIVLGQEWACCQHKKNI